MAFGTQNTEDDWLRAKEVDAMKDSAEQSNPSTGSVQPLAWAVVCPTGEPLTVRWTWHECLDVAGPADEIIPLYRQTQPTLTDAEREVLGRLAERLSDWNMDDAEDVVRGILGRFK